MASWRRPNSSICERAASAEAWYAASMKLAVLAFIIAAIASPAFAASDWNGTWDGNWDNKGDGVQIIMAGNTAAGLYWHGDYVSDDLHTSVSGETLTITCGPAGFEWCAILSRVIAESAHVVMHQPGRG